IRGPQAYLAVSVRGKEPSILPLYAIQVLQEIHDTFGVRLEAWTGDPAELAGIRGLLRKVLFATEADGVSLGPLEDSPVSKIPALLERGLLKGDGQDDFLTWARKGIEHGGYDQGVQVLKRITDATVGPTEEISHQIQAAIIASKEAGTLQITDDQVNSYVDFLRRSLEAAFQAKRRAGIERYWPVARIAVKTDDQLGLDAVVAFLDTRMTKELIAEGYAKEIVELVREARKDMGLETDRVVDIELVAGKDLRTKLQPWKAMILRDANALDVRFVQEPAQEAYVIEAGLGEETFLLGVRAAEM